MKVRDCALKPGDEVIVHVDKHGWLHAVVTDYGRFWNGHPATLFIQPSGHSSTYEYHVNYLEKP